MKSSMIDDLLYILGTIPGVKTITWTMPWASGDFVMIGRTIKTPTASAMALKGFFKDVDCFSVQVRANNTLYGFTLVDSTIIRLTPWQLKMATEYDQYGNYRGSERGIQYA